jgi:hypothetical protein
MFMQQQGLLGNRLQERRIHYGKPDPLGNITNDGEGKGEERKEVDFNGFLQQSLNRVPTAGSCYLSRFQRLCFCRKELYSYPN